MMPTRTTEPATPCAALAGAELVGGEGHRLGEEGVAEPGRQLRRGEQPEHVGRPGVEALRRRPPRLRPPCGR